MSGLGLDLLWASAGLALSALAAALALRLWRREPISAYRLGVAVLAVTLTLPLVQVGARALGLPVPHPLGGLLAGLTAKGTAVERAQPVIEADFALDPAADVVLATAPAPVPEFSFASPLYRSEALPQAVPSVPAVQPDFAAARALRRPVRPAPAWQPSAWLADARLWATLYALGVLAALTHTLRRVLSTRRLLADARPVTCSDVQAAWKRVAQGSPLAARTRLLESERLESPACVGLWRPAVVLPAGHDLAARGDVLECVLTHELVHLERRDAWVLVGEELLRALFWFHPAAWWLVARLERLRELSCDSLVVRRTGKRRRYASALVEYATWMQAGARRPGARVGTMAAVMPWSDSRGQLTRRIEMLLDTRTNTSGRGRVLTPAAVGMAFTFLWSGQLALATSSCASTNAGEHDPHEVHEVHDAAHDGDKHKVKSSTKGDTQVHVITKRIAGHDDDGAHGRVRLIEEDSGGDGNVTVIVIGAGDGQQPLIWRGKADAQGRYQVKGLDGLKNLHFSGPQGAGENVFVEEFEFTGEHDQDVHGNHAKPKAKVKTKAFGLTQSGGKGNVFFSQGGDHDGHEVIELQSRKGSGGIWVQRDDDGPHEQHFEFEVKPSKGKSVFEWRSDEADNQHHDGHALHESEHDVEFDDGSHGKVHVRMHGNQTIEIPGKVSIGGGKAKSDKGKNVFFSQDGPNGRVLLGSPPASPDVEQLRRELEKTRAKLDAQRAEIEELRRALERLSEKRDSLLR